MNDRISSSPQKTSASSSMLKKARCANWPIIASRLRTLTSHTRSSKKKKSGPTRSTRRATTKRST